MKPGMLPHADACHKEECYTTPSGNCPSRGLPRPPWVGGSVNRGSSAWSCRGPTPLQERARKPAQRRERSRGSASWYTTSRPRTRDVEARPSALKGALCSARRSPSGRHRDTGAAPSSHQWHSASLPGAGAARDPPGARASGGGDPRGVPRAQPGTAAALSGAGAPRRAQRTPSPLASRSRRSERGQSQEERVPAARAQNEGRGGAVVRGTPPHSPVRSPRRGEARGRLLGSPARVRPDPNFARPLSPAAAGAPARTEGAVSQPRRRCRLGPRGGGTAARGPRPPSVCWEPAALPLRRKLPPRPLGLRYRRRPASSASRPNAVIDRAAASRAPSAARPWQPSPSPAAPPPARGRRPRPLPVTRRRGGAG